MSLPVQSLPIIQNWDCHGCSDCCRTYHVRVSAAERERIEKQDWDEALLGGRRPIIWDATLGSDRLNHTDEGACVFLGPDNRCRIHAKFGPEAKPAACRIYPFALAPAGDQWRVGLRYACPSAADNLGRPLPEHAADVAEYAALLEEGIPGSAAELPPPPLQRGQTLAWPDLLRFADAVDDLLADPRVPFEQRIRRVLTFARLAKPVRTEALTAGVRPMLKVLAAAAVDETPADRGTISPPGWVGRMLFRQTAVIYSRKDNGPDAGIARTGKFVRIQAAWRFARGRGIIPRLHAAIPEGVTFADAERPLGELDRDSTLLLTRYYRVKVQSMQFCGRPNFDVSFWDGLDGLILTFPVVMWLTRALSKGATGSQLATLTRAIRMVDDNFGFNSLLGNARHTWAVRTLADRGELTRLAAWYGR